MNPETNESGETMMSLVKQNHDLLLANNELLTKINRREVRQFWFKVVWYAILLGVPMFAYYYLYNAFLGDSGVVSTEPTLNLETLQEVMRIYQGVQ
jgi:hypothetical protein